MECFWQKVMRLDELRKPGWVDAAYYLFERDEINRTTKLKVPAVVQPQSKNEADSSALRTLGEPTETLGHIPGTSLMPQVTSRTGSCHMRIGLRKS